MRSRLFSVWIFRSTALVSPENLIVIQNLELYQDQLNYCVYLDKISKRLVNT